VLGSASALDPSSPGTSGELVVNPDVLAYERVEISAAKNWWGVEMTISMFMEFEGAVKYVIGLSRFPPPP